MSLSSCDGGHKDNLSKPENALTDNWSSEGKIHNTQMKQVLLSIYTGKCHVLCSFAVSAMQLFSKCIEHCPTLLLVI